MDRTSSPDPDERRAATLGLTLRLQGAERYERVRLELESARFTRGHDPDVMVGLEGRRLELQARLGFTMSVEFAAPSGSYEALTLILRSVGALPDRGASWVELASVAAVTITAPIDLKGDAAAAASAVLDLDAILSASPFDDDREEAMEHWRRIASPRPATIRLNEGSIDRGRRPWAEVRWGSRAFELGAELNLRRGSVDALPELFRGQRALGPVLEVTASSPPRGWLDITLSYSPADLGRSGFESRDIRVLQLLRDRRQYREIYPYRVDTANHTVSVRVNSLSAFFACSPGILIDYPRLQINAAGEVVAYASARETPIAGRVVDGQGIAVVLTQVSRSSWHSAGWFVHEGVPLGPSDTLVTLGVLGGGIGHLCDFTIRRGLPTKTVTRPNASFAGTPGFGDDGTAFVATAVRHTIDMAGIEGIDPLRRFLSSGMDWSIPTLFWFNADADQWWSFRLSSDRFHLNELARVAIDQIARNLQREVPINPDYPEDVRHLRSLADFVAGFTDPNPGLALWLVINVVARLLDADNLAVSPRLPLVTLDGGHVGCAFVAASYEGWRARTRSSVDSFLRRRHVPRRSERGPELGMNVAAGRLFYVRASRDGVAETEVVADAILCGALSLKVNPTLGQPAILAIGLPPEDGAGVGESELLLFQRQEDGQWTREVVWQGQPIIDADMDFGFGDRPVVVAAVEARDEALNAGLFYLPPTHPEPGWDPRPLTWNLPGFPLDAQLGMWPRIVVSSWPPEESRTVYCGFTYFTEDTVFWLAGTPDADGRWQVVEAGQGTRATLAAVSNLAPPPQGFADDVVGFSRVSPYHWACSLAPRADGSVWYAFGNGVLHLARFDGTTVIDRIVDVDRATGFRPELATRRSAPGAFDPPGAPVVAYKDVHGASTLHAASGVEFATGLDLHFYDLATSHQVPQISPPDVPTPLGAPTPRHSYAQANIGDFGTRVPFTCGRFSAIVANSFLNPLTGRGLSPAEVRQFINDTQASIFLNSPIDIHARPEEGLLEVTIRNDRPNEPDAIRSMLLRQRTGGRPRLFVTDSTGTVGDGACGFMQDTWDTIAADFINVPVDPAGLIPPDDDVQIRDVRLEEIRISFSAAAGFTSQQGAVRFRIDLASIRTEGAWRGLGFAATSTEPSVFEFEVAPFVVDGGISWHVRSTSGRIGHIDVDVDLDFLTWIGVIGGILGSVPLPSAVSQIDSVAGTFAANLINEQLAGREGLPLGGLPDQLIGLLAAHALRKAFGTETDLSSFTFEAVHLGDLLTTTSRSNPFITYFLRLPRGTADALPATDFAFFPEQGRDLGSVTVGETSGVRSVLLVNSGSFPVSLEGVQVVGSSDFVLVGPAVWPKIIAPGASEQLDLEFRPQSGSGFRRATLRAEYNGLLFVELLLSGTAQPALLPEIRAIPPQLNFGVVNVGTTAALQLALVNEGGAPLAITSARIEGPDAALFTLPGQLPTVVQAGQAASLGVSFAPAAMVAGGYRATLALESNADNDPRLGVSLFGAGAVSNLLVTPTQLAFNPSPLASTLPPGLGSTRSFTVYNVGVVSLTIGGSSFRVLDAGSGQPSPHFELLDSAGQPFPQDDLQLNSGAFQSLSVQFRPVVAGDHATVIEITPTDLSQASVTVFVSGRGIG